MTHATEFAVLAPVPLQHLEAGEQVAADTGFVAFGSRKWELFRKVDDFRGGSRVPVLMYPSWEGQRGTFGLIVSWFGWYDGYVEAKAGAHPLGMKHRPPTTATSPTDNLGHWAVYWHVCELHALPAAKRIAIGKLKTVRGGWRKDAPPRGPELVQTPESLDL